MAKKSKLIIKPARGGVFVFPKAERPTLKRIGVVAVDSGTFCIVDPCYGSTAEELERADMRAKKFTIVSKQLSFPKRGTTLRICKSTAARCRFAVVHITGIGDGFFPVFAEYEGRHVRRVWVDLPGDIDRNGPPTVPARRRRK